MDLSPENCDSPNHFRSPMISVSCHRREGLISPGSEGSSAYGLVVSRKPWLREGVGERRKVGRRVAYK